MDNEDELEDKERLKRLHENVERFYSNDDVLRNKDAEKPEGVVSEAIGLNLELFKDLKRSTHFVHSKHLHDYITENDEINFAKISIHPRNRLSMRKALPRKTLRKTRNSFDCSLETVLEQSNPFPYLFPDI